MDALEIINNIRQQLDALEAQIKQMPAANISGTSLAALNLSTRARTHLERWFNVTTIEELLEFDVDKLSAIVPGIGEATQREIKEKLAAYKQQ